MYVYLFKTPLPSSKKHTEKFLIWGINILICSYSYSYLTKSMLGREKEEADEMKQAKEDEEEKAMYSVSS